MVNIYIYIYMYNYIRITQRRTHVRKNALCPKQCVFRRTVFDFWIEHCVKYLSNLSKNVGLSV